jgi:hypothetical protein
MYEPPNARAALTNITVTRHAGLGHFHFHVSSLTPLAVNILAVAARPTKV